MEQYTFVLKFEGASVAEGNKLAASLREALLGAHPDIEAERHRDDPDSQDFGASLVLVLGTPAVVAAVAAIKTWLRRTNASSLQIWTKQGVLVANNLESKDVPGIVSAMTGRPKT